MNDFFYLKFTQRLSRGFYSFLFLAIVSFYIFYFKKMQWIEVVYLFLTLVSLAILITPSLFTNTPVTAPEKKSLLAYSPYLIVGSIFLVSLIVKFYFNASIPFWGDEIYQQAYLSPL